MFRDEADAPFFPFSPPFSPAPSFLCLSRYAVEYDGAGAVAWALDGVPYYNLTARAAAGAPAPLFFDAPYYVILNTAVGGPWPAPPDAGTAFPTYHAVDYVRVAQPAPRAAARRRRAAPAIAPDDG